MKDRRDVIALMLKAWLDVWHSKPMVDNRVFVDICVRRNTHTYSDCAEILLRTKRSFGEPINGNLYWRRLYGRSELLRSKKSVGLLYFAEITINRGIDEIRQVGGY